MCYMVIPFDPSHSHVYFHWYLHCLTLPHRMRLEFWHNITIYLRFWKLLYPKVGVITCVLANLLSSIDQIQMSKSITPVFCQICEKFMIIHSYLTHLKSRLRFLIFIYKCFYVLPAVASLVKLSVNPPFFKIHIACKKTIICVPKQMDWN